MIWVKYNGRYHFFDKDRTLNSEINNDMPTRAETQTLPCKNIRIKVYVLKKALQATITIFFPFLVA